LHPNIRRQMVVKKTGAAVKSYFNGRWGIGVLILILPLALAGIMAVIVNRPVAEAPVAPEQPSPTDIITAPASPKQPVAQPERPAPPRLLQHHISDLSKAFDGNVGIAIISMNDGWMAGHQAQRIFPQQSVSKLWVATATLEKVDKGEMALSDPITLTPADLTIFHQPVRKYIMTGNFKTSIAELMRYAITQSDNTANDALYRLVGGQQGVAGHIARNTLGQIAIGPGEKILQTEMAGMTWNDAFSYGRTFWQVRNQVPTQIRAKALARYLAQPPDGASPQALADGLTRLHQGKLLSAKSTALLLDLMNQSKTGPDRLRGGLSPGWTMAHKTGTGQVLGNFATAYNDVGILHSPKGRSYSLVVMIASTSQSVKARQDFMQAITRSVIACEEMGPSCG
jgi:beta-lactamase class A